MSEVTASHRTIALVGLPGSGKTAVGQCLAEILGRRFVDLDDLVTVRTGRSPQTWFAEEGEQRFREVESAALADVIGPADTVLATGGGSVIDPRNRWALAQQTTMVWIDAQDEILLDRIARSGVVRPLLQTAAAGGPAAALAALRFAREPFYRATDIHVDSSRPVDAVTRQLLDIVERVDTTRAVAPRRIYFDAVITRRHPNGPTHARVVFGHDLGLAATRSVLEGISLGQPLVVADERAEASLPHLMAALPAGRRLSVRGGESIKRMRAVERLLEAASRIGTERGDAWIAVGGGTTGDMVGTAAALYHRGAPLVHVPTTWLAQTDSALGGKTAVDLAHAKNAAGAFWPPVAVIADVASLRTLSRPRLLDGMAESLKAAVIGDPALWAVIEQHGRSAVDPSSDAELHRYAIVERAARLKLAVVERDPYERGERRQLNLGHTIGHALEVESRYRLPHGQAVVLGLRAVTAIAQGRGAEPKLAEQIDDLVSSLGFPMHRRFDPAAVRSALISDKKRVGGRQRWILPMAIGRVIEADDVSEAELDHALDVISAEAH